MALADSNDRFHGNWFLKGFSPEQQQRLIQIDLEHEDNVCPTDGGITHMPASGGIPHMPASALGCLCLMQRYGEMLNPMKEERKAGRDGCFPFQRWHRAFQVSPYLSLTNITERDALDFWLKFSTTDEWEKAWKPWTESMTHDDIRARCYYMSWLPSVDKRLRVKWGHAFTDVFRFELGPFGYEIAEVLSRPDWLDADRITDPSSNDEESKAVETREVEEEENEAPIPEEEISGNT